MGDAEGVPEDDVAVVDGGAAVADPFGDTPAGLAGCLGDVAAGGVELVVGVWCDMNSVAGETCALPYQRSLLRKEIWYFSAHELVADWLVAVWVYFVGVCHLPRS